MRSSDAELILRQWRRFWRHASCRIFATRWFCVTLRFCTHALAGQKPAPDSGRERRKRAESAPKGVPSGRTGVRAIAAIPLRARIAFAALSGRPIFERGRPMEAKVDRPMTLKLSNERQFDRRSLNMGGLVVISVPAVARRTGSYPRALCALSVRKQGRPQVLRLVRRCARQDLRGLRLRQRGLRSLLRRLRPSDCRRPIRCR
jgi:hypothetical protein